jgi:hypothetical protein
LVFFLHAVNGDVIIITATYRKTKKKPDHDESNLNLLKQTLDQTAYLLMG